MKQELVTNLWAAAAGVLMAIWAAVLVWLLTKAFMFIVGV